MSPLERYSPPGFLADFDHIPDQLAQWSAAVSGWFDECIAFESTLLPPGERCQYYNQLYTFPPAPIYEQAIVWNGLSGTLRNRYGRAAALERADKLMPLTQRMDGPGSYFVGPQWEHLFYRPDDEYCEWRVDRAADGSVVRITFTSEPPEYWQALHGDALPDINGNPRYPTTGDRQLLVELYRRYVSPDVRYEDLVCTEDLIDHSDPRHPVVVYAKGTYNPYNRWNTTDGIMHLSHPANSLGAEIRLGADATILRAAGGRALTDPDALVCCSAYGGPNRASDPTIGSSVNALAAAGAYVTLRDPVGLAMHHVDLSGISTPDGRPIGSEYWRVLRGDATQGQIERAEFAVPVGEHFTVSDLRIGGTPIRFGGQIAERIAVNLVGVAGGFGTFHNSALACVGRCCAAIAGSDYLRGTRVNAPCPTDFEPAYAYAPPFELLAFEGSVAPELPMPPVHRSRGF